MARRGYVFTPARRAALAKARAARSLKSRSNAASHRRIYGSNPVKRGQGVAGLRKNLTPYARVNKRSQTVGANAGTIIPGTSKRLVFGGYVRLENRSRSNSLDRAISRGLSRAAPKGSKAGGVRKFINENVHVDAPAIRANVGGAQVRLGTSRGGGTTVIVRRGKHKPTYRSSKAGVVKYSKRQTVLAGKKKKARKQRRGKK